MWRNECFIVGASFYFHLQKYAECVRAGKKHPLIVYIGLCKSDNLGFGPNEMP